MICVVDVVVYIRTLGTRMLYTERDSIYNYTSGNIAFSRPCIEKEGTKIYIGVQHEYDL